MIGSNKDFDTRNTQILAVFRCYAYTGLVRMDESRTSWKDSGHILHLNKKKRRKEIVQDQMTCGVSTKKAGRNTKNNPPASQNQSSLVLSPTQQHSAVAQWFIPYQVKDYPPRQPRADASL